MTTPSARRVLVVADDLTGATDTGVQFAEAGWATRLQRRAGTWPGERPGERPGAEVDVAVAVSTQCRAAATSLARERTRAAIQRPAGDGGEQLVYLKIDSTMRGSVAGQVQGALEARRGERPDAFAVLCPAYPEMGRTVVGGQVLVHGEPVTSSPAGSDPVTPVRHADVGALVPGAAIVPVAADAASWRGALLEAAQDADVVCADAGTQRDLELLAEALAGLGDQVVAAGSAGLAAPLARRWRSRVPAAYGTGARERTSGRSLVVVSSHHQVAREQVRRLAQRRGVGVVGTTVAGLGSGEVPDAPDDDCTVLLSPEHRAAHETVAVAEGLAAWAASWVRADPPAYDTLVLVGGDGAQAVLSALDADGIVLHGRLLEGVPDGSLAGGPAEGLRVVTKAGGFGDADTLLDLHSLVTDHRPDLQEQPR